MSEYVKAMRSAFGTAADLASFMGVATVTVNSWCTGKRNPGRVETRLLQVLGVLLVENKALFKAIVQSKAAVRPTKVVPEHKPIVGPYWSPGTLPVVTDEIRAMLREAERESTLMLPPVPPPPSPRPKGKRDDSYWFERSVSSEDAWENGTEQPVVRIRRAELARMTDEQVDAFWYETTQYRRRTGRFVPDAV
jgi:hypothetical protein